MRFKRKKKEKYSEEDLKRINELFSLDFWESDISEIVPDLQIKTEKTRSKSTAIIYEFDKLPSDIKEFDMEWKNNVSELDIDLIIEDWNQLLANEEENKGEKNDKEIYGI